MSTSGQIQSAGPDNLIVSYHARERLEQRFPGRECVVLSKCEDFYQRMRDFTGGKPYRHIVDRTVAVIDHGVLITVYERPQRVMS